MARAYMVLARNDLDENALQVLDLVPNTSQRNFPYTPAGQTGYVTHYPQADAFTLTNDAGVRRIDQTAYGVQVYLIDVVEDTTGGNLAITAADASDMTDAIFARVVAGSTLQAADLNAVVAGVLGAGNDFDGTLGASTGTVEELLRILSGEVYRIVEDTAVSGAANAFLPARVGAFVTAPSRVRLPLSGPGGRSPFNQPTVDTSNVSQAVVTNRLLGAGVSVTVPATADLNYREFRMVVDTPELHISVLEGNLSHLVDTAFVFQNGSFTYGAGGTATFLDATALPSTGVGRALVVYKATGEVI